MKAFHLCKQIKHDKTFWTSQHSVTPICNPSSDNIDGHKQLRNENPFRIIIGHININSVRNEFGSLIDLASANLDVLVISETKTDGTFSESQFIIEGFWEP